jgi:hypothetical protein
MGAGSYRDRAQGSEMKITSMFLAICALFTGLLAAFYWYKSSVVKARTKNRWKVWRCHGDRTRAMDGWGYGRLR